MKKIIYSIIWILILQVFTIACKDDEPVLSDPPADTEAMFTVTPTATNPNIIKVSTEATTFLVQWDLGNGQKSSEREVVVTYPLKGSYEVSLTVFNAGGSLTTKQTVVIAQTDFSLFTASQMTLAGGDSEEGKTWVVDSQTPGHMGVGPIGGTWPEYWSAPPNIKSGCGLYDDEYSFSLYGYKMTWDTKGDAYVHNKQKDKFPGAVVCKDDYQAPVPSSSNVTWSIAKNGNKEYLTITNGSFLGLYTGVSQYEIISFSPNLIYLKYTDSADAGLAWYLRLIPKGYVPPLEFSTLPIDFEGTGILPFEGFGDTKGTYTAVANPHSGGLNTSAKVGKYVRGSQNSGIISPLDSKLDFATKTVIRYSVYSTITGKAKVKLEASDDSAAPVEAEAMITQANQWQELTFDFAGAVSDKYNKIALLLDVDNSSSGGTFYLDDIRQVLPNELSMAVLTGGSSKAWILKPAAGSFGVGPNKGSDEWYPNGGDLSVARACLFDDEFIFKTGGIYEYDSKGDIWAEGYMGITPDGCNPESSLPTNAQAWGSGTHAFTIIPAEGSTPASIKVTGTGAFIALPKAFNGGEYSAAPPVADRSVTYEVMEYTKSGADETLKITINIGPGYWSFVLIPK
jgi:PKD repeat protein